MPEPDLLMTKFTIPPLRSALLHRSHLLTVLDQSCAVPLTLLSAGAGFGKTTLLSTWARQSAGHAAWLTLDEQDNDPTRFWAYVIAALRTCLPIVGEMAIALLHSLQPPALITVLTSLINDLAAQSRLITLIVEDYHLIEEPAIHDSLTFFLDHAPVCLRLVLSSRVDPPLALSRWRVRGQMVEIREGDLRLSEQDAAVFLRQTM